MLPSILGSVLLLLCVCGCAAATRLPHAATALAKGPTISSPSPKPIDMLSAAYTAFNNDYHRSLNLKAIAKQAVKKKYFVFFIKKKKKKY